MKNVIKGLFLSLFTILILSHTAFAFNVDQTGLKETATNAGFTEVTDKNAVLIKAGGIIQVVIGVLGFVLMIFIVYAGIKWMTAGGDTTATKTAQSYITNGIIGMIIIAGAYAISTYVIQSLTTVIAP